MHLLFSLSSVSRGKFPYFPGFGVPLPGAGTGAPRRAPWQQNPKESSSPGCTHIWDQRDATSSSLAAAGFKANKIPIFLQFFGLF